MMSEEAKAVLEASDRIVQSTASITDAVNDLPQRIAEAVMRCQPAQAATATATNTAASPSSMLLVICGISALSALFSAGVDLISLLARPTSENALAASVPRVFSGTKESNSGSSSLQNIRLYSSSPTPKSTAR